MVQKAELRDQALYGVQNNRISTAAEVDEQEVDSRGIGTIPSENEGQPHNIKDTPYLFYIH